MSKLLTQIESPADLQRLTDAELAQVAQEVRAELVRVLSMRPAHFASNLGVVELCLALHLTFDFSRDRLIWDTGHQIYPHKLLTGRYPQFRTFLEIMMSENVQSPPPVAYQLYLDDRVTWTEEMAARGALTPAQALARLERDVGRERERRRELGYRE